MVSFQDPIAGPRCTEARMSTTIPQMNPDLPIGAPVDRPMPLVEQWILDHGKHFVGRWVALRDYDLVGVANSYFELRKLIGPRRDVICTLLD
jgi:hypothetical protein